jgi:hypothetical protein
MRQATRSPSRVGCVVRGLGGTARTIGGGDPIPFACLGLALLGLLVGLTAANAGKFTVTTPAKN